MRITFSGHTGPDIALPLAKALGAHLISPEIAFDPATGMPSDDRLIRLIIEKILQDTAAHEGENSFLLNSFPINVIQAQSLDMALAQACQPLDACIMTDSTKMLQNRENKALIRYYRSQNKLILINDSSSVEDICEKIYSIHNKRRKNSA